MPGSAKEKSAHTIAEFQPLYRQGRTLPRQRTGSRRRYLEEIQW